MCVTNYKNSNFSVNRGKYSHSYGNTFYDITDTYTKLEDQEILLTTGAAPERNVSNNIYDIAGNVEEYLAACYCNHNDWLLAKGGSYRVNSRGFLSGNIYTYSESNDDLGFRSCIFLK